MDKDYILTDFIVFNSKPDAVPYHYRLSYKIALACLIFGLSCGRSGCSLSKLHMIIVCMYSEKEMVNLLNFVNETNNNYIVLRYDPTVNKTVDFMLAEKIIFQQANGLFRLTKSGIKFFENIMKDQNLLVNEKKFLRDLSSKLTEKLINRIKSSLLG
ncbi:hypothetical protein [Pseudoneobacillus rhizosphaerae]|uniref:Uncharacterized protein n=1 Tax=Pseudoneobacillus rhizosphaerae TaxID=2880968 RepID=A0A9C7G786_9BACI|nr:hypothetical protein [Pseudoneobacillus rhizosphaerae]CAG9606848.1 hypothetical protein NEOCIP111885_00536 [Pseudoneobacillus rhizosphaerae]